MDFISLCQNRVLIKIPNEPRVEFIPAATEPMKSWGRGSEWACLIWAGKVGLMHTKPEDRSLKLCLRMIPTECLSCRYVSGTVKDTQMNLLLLSLFPG